MHELVLLRPSLYASNAAASAIRTDREDRLVPKGLVKTFIPKKPGMITAVSKG